MDIHWTHDIWTYGQMFYADRWSKKLFLKYERNGHFSKGSRLSLYRGDH